MSKLHEMRKLVCDRNMIPPNFGNAETEYIKIQKL